MIHDEFEWFDLNLNDWDESDEYRWISIIQDESIWLKMNLMYQDEPWMIQNKSEWFKMNLNDSKWIWII